MLRILSEAEEVEYVTEVAHFSRQENHDSVASSLVLLLSVPNEMWKRGVADLI